MSAPIFDRPPATSPSASATRRRRLPLLIVASLMVAGAGLGTGVALADGKSREDAQYLTVWLRNQNPRLRTLPLAAELRVRFHHTCEEPSDRRAVLTKLAVSATAAAAAPAPPRVPRPAATPAPPPPARRGHGPAGAV